ncbi:MAG: glycosyltransferase, partial [Treponema porcinum]|uniref:UDP-N-acetylglucosamine--N-acetylmuramyl- (pentapeptide) pyrophosphoryl-undecaprenol N-acetylglucosamine transferase n=1 Tax=Treponema porcinum TaxID=261392 RepID=UPI002A832F96
MVKNKSDITIVCAGGGTGGHIYPGLAVADAVRTVCAENNRTVHIYWIGNSSGMDKTIVEKNIGADGKPSADRFYGIPSGKLRRYFSLKNFFDLFKIFAGFIASFFILLKIKPDVLFSKGGFVSVPPCFSARILRIPVYTHECDFTPGLATRINAKSAKKILVSYKETAGFLGVSSAQKCIVTGNPVRPVFYSASAERGRSFLGIEAADKPVLLVLGGSLGARQINYLVKENIEWLCRRFIVVHQTGTKNADDFVMESA